MRQCVRCQAQRHSCSVRRQSRRVSIEPSGPVSQKCCLAALRPFAASWRREPARSRAPPSFFGRRLSVEAMSLAPICCEPGSLFLAVVPQIAGVSCARLRFSAAIKIDHRWRDDLLDRPRRKQPPRNHNGDLAASPAGKSAMLCGRPLRRTNQNGLRNSRKIVARRRRPIYSLSISLRRSEIDAQSQVVRT